MTFNPHTADDRKAMLAATGADSSEAFFTPIPASVRFPELRLPAVLTEMERRLGMLGFAWADTTAVQAYTVHDIHPFLADELVRRGAARPGLTWHYCRPPVVDLEYEMDCRGVSVERVV